MAKEHIKKRVKKAEDQLGVGQIDPRNTARVFWKCDDVYNWYLPNGEIEVISEAEYVARGGHLITWDDKEK